MKRECVADKRVRDGHKADKDGVCLAPETTTSLTRCPLRGAVEVAISLLPSW